MYLHRRYDYGEFDDQRRGEDPCMLARDRCGMHALSIFNLLAPEKDSSILKSDLSALVLRWRGLAPFKCVYKSPEIQKLVQAKSKPR